MDKRKTLGVAAAASLTAVGLMLTTLAFGNNFKASTRLKASDYSLTLNSNNGISGTNVTTTKSITTDSGAYEVAFDYTNCSSFNGGHATINAGGKIVNKDHIRSIYSLVANFTTSGELKFRTSYDGATWGGYTSMKSSEEYELGSHPYYVEFTTDGTNSVNLTSVQFSYSCEENPAAIGTETEPVTYYELCTSDSDLVVGDLYIITNVGDGTGYALTSTIANSYYLEGEQVTVSDNKITLEEDSAVCPLLLGGTSGAYTFANSNSTSQYLFDGGTYNSLYWSNTGTTWSINLTDHQIFSDTPHYLYYRESYSTFTSYQYGSSYTTYLFHKVTKSGGTEYDTPVDENGFTAVDNNKDNYTTNSIFDSANGLVVKATFTDGSTQTLSKGSEGYSYVVKNSSGALIDTSAKFPAEDVYTLVVSYKKYIPVEITLNVGVYLEMQSIVVSSDVLTYNTADKLSDYLAGHVTARVTYNVSSYNKENIAYADFGTYGLSLTLLNPSGVTYSTTSAFGTAGTWTIRVSNSSDATVYGELDITVNAIMVQTITVNGNEALTLQQTKTAQLTITVNPTNATNTAVTWASDDESVATVSANGVVTGVGVGTCNVTATAADGSGVVGTCAVTVTAYEGAADEGTFVLNTSGAPKVGSYVVIASSYEGSAYAMSSTQATNNRSGVSITIENQVIERDSNSGFSAFLVTEGNQDDTIAFYDEGNGGYLYAASSSKNYLRTESTLSDNSSFTVTGDEAKTIEAQGTNSRNLLKWNSQSTLFSCYASGQANPYIFEKGGEVVYPTSISLSGETAIGVGGSSQLTVSYTPSNTTVKSVTWTSSDDTVAGVSNGLVTGIKAGSATITATAVAENGTITATANVTVSNVAVTSVSLDKTTASIAKDETVTLTPTIAPSNATNKNVTWSTSDNSVATVNGGVVTGISAGTATITVKTEDGNKTASCAITVTSSGGSGSGVSGSLTIAVSDMPSAYGTNTFTKEGFGFYSSNIASGYSAGNMQWKSGAGTLYNTTAIDGLTSITISSGTTGSFSATIYSGTSSQPTTNSASLSTGTYTFPDGVSYFKIVSSSGAKYCGDIGINYSTEPVDPTAISVSPSTFELSAGKTKTLSVSYTPSSANQNKAVTWSSSNTNVATVDTSGIVTVKENASVGATATITATLTNLTSIKATATITVVEQALADHTVLIYMCGADLESSYASNNEGLATGDITEILNIANQPDDVNIVIETGGASKWSSTYGISSTYLQRWHVEDQTLKLDASLTYASMGASSTLQSFIEYGLNNYPASRTGLVLWNHGGAMRGVCYDEKKNDDNLLDYEVISAVSGAFSSTGRTDKLEWIGYDACLMGVQDIVEFNSEYFNYMIASEESEAGYGWDYDTWVDDLYANKATTVILKAIVDGFITDNGGTSSSSNDQTLAYYNLSYASAYMKAWEAMASQLSSKLTSSNKSSFNSLVKGCKYYADSDYTYFGLFDAKDFINKLAANSTFNPGSTYTNAVLTAHSNLVAYSSCGKGAGNSYGIAMFWSAASDSGKSSYYTSSTTHFSTWRSIVSTYGS